MGIVWADGTLAQSGKMGTNGSSSACFALEMEMWPQERGMFLLESLMFGENKDQWN